VISSPTSVFIEGYGREVSMLEVTTKGGDRETVKFMDPLLLSAT
jgi:hypothetical protein